MVSKETGNGNKVTQYNLGKCYQDGLGTEKKHRKSN